MIKSFLTCCGLICINSSAMADPITVTKTYNYSHPVFASQDAACVTSILEKIAPKFVGLSEISLSSNSMVETQNGALAIYAGVKFISQYGNAEGTINCVFASNRKSITDIAIVFEGRGLGGHKARGRISGSKDPASWKSTSLAVTVVE